MYAVKGQVVADDGELWWKIEAEGRDQAWVEQAAVHAMGACEEVVEAEIPPVIVADTSDPADTSADVGDTGDPGDAQTGGKSGEYGFCTQRPDDLECQSRSRSACRHMQRRCQADQLLPITASTGPTRHEHRDARHGTDTIHYAASA